MKITKSLKRVALLTLFSILPNSSSADEVARETCANLVRTATVCSLEAANYDFLRKNEDRFKSDPNARKRTESALADIESCIENFTNACMREIEKLEPRL